jgi:hypothetical protein
MLVLRPSVDGNRSCQKDLRTAAYITRGWSFRSRKERGPAGLISWWVTTIVALETMGNPPGFAPPVYLSCGKR